jgi:hypothetical protein
MLEGLLPSLLMPKNFPILPQQDRSLLRIITTTEDADVAKNSPKLQKCREFLDVEFVLGDHLIDHDNKYLSMSRLYQLGFSLQGDHYFVYLTPDIFLPNGIVSRLLDYTEKRVKALLVFGIRVVKSRFLPDIIEHLDANNNAVDTQTLVKKILSNLHPLSHNFDVLKDRFNNQWPSHLYWIGKESLIAHGFHLHPLMVFQSKSSPLAEGSKNLVSTIDDKDFLSGLGYKPEDTLVATDLNQVMAVEMSDIHESIADNSSQEIISRPSIFHILSWSEKYTNNFHWNYMHHKGILSLDKSCNIKVLTSQSNEFTKKLLNTHKNFFARSFFRIFIFIQAFIDILKRYIGILIKAAIHPSWAILKVRSKALKKPL